MTARIARGDVVQPIEDVGREWCGLGRSAVITSASVARSPSPQLAVRAATRAAIVAARLGWSLMSWPG